MVGVKETEVGIFLDDLDFYSGQEIYEYTLGYNFKNEKFSNNS